MSEESGRLVWADGKATISQITAHDNKGMQKSIYERQHEVDGLQQ